MSSQPSPSRPSSLSGGDLPKYDTDISAVGGWWRDLRDALKLTPVWMRLSLMDVSSQHRRFFLGATWVTLGMTIFVFALGYVYSYLRNEEYAVFTPYLAAGMVAWTFMSSAITGGLNVFAGRSRFIENVQLPFHYYVFKTLSEISITAAMTIPVFGLCMILFDIRPGWTILWALPGLAIYMLTAFGVLIVMGVTNLKIRDIQTPLSNFMRLMFLVTPVIWMLEGREGTKRAAFVEYNPFFYFLDIFRSPLLGNVPEMRSWIVTASVAAFFFLAGIFVMIRARTRIHYWI